MNPTCRRAGRSLPLACSALLLSVCFSALVSSPARAGANSDARIAIHLASRTTKNVCTRAEAAPACSNIVANGALYPTLYYGYLLVMKGDAPAGLGGLQCGIQYNGAARQGVDIYGWTLCATLEFASGGWPAAGSGNLITWDTATRCQRGEPGGPGTGVTATAGYFYLAAYTPDILQITTRPVDGTAKVADCRSNEDLVEGGVIHHDPSFLGSANFSGGGGAPGYNPCVAPTLNIDCSISGPGLVPPASTNSYSAAGADPGSGFQWSITGNGTIVGSSQGQSVSVAAGPAADGHSYTLAVIVTVGTASSTCSRVVNLDIPVAPACSINGASSVVEGTANGVYTAGGTQTIHSYSWGITGNGTITSSLTAPGVTVQAGDIGAFELTLQATFEGGIQTTCSRTVTVTALTCGILGFDSVTAFAPNLSYAAQSPVTGSTYLWQISGNGAIAGSNQNATVVVNAGTVGAFTLTLTQTRGGAPHTCFKTVTVVGNAGGGHQNLNAKLLIHLTPTTTKSECGVRGTPSCNMVVTAGALSPTNYFAYLIVLDGSAPAGIGGLQCGIAYDGAPGAGVDIFSWSLCATLEFASAGPYGGWPAAGAGNLITWDAAHCQRFEPGGAGTGVSAAAGYFYLTAYSPDELVITPRPVDGQAKVADCGAGEDVIGGTGGPGGYSHLGFANFTAGGFTPGYNPCGTAEAVQSTTWSRIKGMYAQPTTH